MEKEWRELSDSIHVDLSCRCVDIRCSSNRSIIMGREFVGGLMVATCFYMIVAIIILTVIGVI